MEDDKVSNASSEKADIVQRFLTWKREVQKEISGYLEELSVSRIGLLTIPTVNLLLASALCLGIFNIQNFPLSYIGYYNLFKIFMNAISEFFIFSFFWAFDKMNHYITSWKLVKTSVTFRDVMNANQATYDKKYISFILLFFRALSIYLIITANWAILESSIGAYPCSYFDFTQISSFVPIPEKLDTVLDYPLCYGMGFPLSDGFLAGFTGFPFVFPTTNFSFIIDQAPLVAIRTDCAYDLVPYNGSLYQSANEIPIPLGSGYHIISSHVYLHSFNIELDIHFPSAGFDPSVYNFTNEFGASSWMTQRCSLYSYLGKAKWEFQYNIDEWDVTSGGEAVALNIPGFPQLRRGQTSQLPVDPYIKYMRSIQDLPINYNFSTNISEGTVLLQALFKSVNATFNNRWWAPSQGVVSSNVAGWGTAPSGYYFPEISYRGLSFGVATAFHQVFEQSGYGAETLCEYNGFSGSGAIQMNQIGVTLITIIIATLMIVYLIQLVFYAYIYHVRPKEAVAFRLGSYCVKNEILLITNVSTWLASGNHKHKKNALDFDLDRFSNIQLRFGKASGHINQNIGGLWIGPKKNTRVYKIDPAVGILKQIENDANEAEQVEQEKTNKKQLMVQNNRKVITSARNIYDSEDILESHSQVLLTREVKDEHSHEHSHEHDKEKGKEREREEDQDENENRITSKKPYTSLGSVTDIIITFSKSSLNKDMNANSSLENDANFDQESDKEENESSKLKPKGTKGLTGMMLALSRTSLVQPQDSPDGLARADSTKEHNEGTSKKESLKPIANKGFMNMISKTSLVSHESDPEEPKHSKTKSHTKSDEKNKEKGDKKKSKKDASPERKSSDHQPKTPELPHSLVKPHESKHGKRSSIGNAGDMMNQDRTPGQSVSHESKNKNGSKGESMNHDRKTRKSISNDHEHDDVLEEDDEDRSRIKSNKRSSVGAASQFMAKMTSPRHSVSQEAGKMNPLLGTGQRSQPIETQGKIPTTSIPTGSNVQPTVPTPGPTKRTSIGAIAEVMTRAVNPRASISLTATKSVHVENNNNHEMKRNSSTGTGGFGDIMNKLSKSPSQDKKETDKSPSSSFFPGSVSGEMKPGPQ